MGLRQFDPTWTGDEEWAAREEREDLMGRGMTWPEMLPRMKALLPENPAVKWPYCDIIKREKGLPIDDAKLDAYLAECAAIRRRRKGA